ncbi:hypothetical protein BS50DRAFT_680300 [Corynespora cassiicola Philippines]|uniref:Uncharacterized protein n=1 Tax=Corynespora cassiicola Philippines TaxID=1448308 RepID=A0A2T2N9C0_CORCC|nr:hypothetical protein BS50DRAFT_680300 [Corynespora cassiicola Philippines]
MALFLTCKRMYADVMRFMADATAFEVYDLESLRMLQSGVIATRLTSHSTFTECVLPSLKELRITLKFPLSAYEEMEILVDITGSQSPMIDSLISSWMQLGSAVEGLGQLKRLQVWLDHEETCSWSVVNERAALSPVLEISNNRDLDIYLNLPKIPPNMIHTERHYNENDENLSLSISRRHRQRVHGVDAGGGSIKEKFKPDLLESDILSEKRVEKIA